MRLLIFFISGKLRRLKICALVLSEMKNLSNDMDMNSIKFGFGASNDGVAFGQKKNMRYGKADKSRWCPMIMSLFSCCIIIAALPQERISAYR